MCISVNVCMFVVGRHLVLKTPEHSPTLSLNLGCRTLLEMCNQGGSGFYRSYIGLIFSHSGVDLSMLDSVLERERCAASF